MNIFFESYNQNSIIDEIENIGFLKIFFHLLFSIQIGIEIYRKIAREIFLLIIIYRTEESYVLSDKR
jgi:hypothetical protein